MAIYKRFSPNLFSGFWVVVMIAMWLAFAPIQAGGEMCVSAGAAG